MNKTIVITGGSDGLDKAISFIINTGNDVIIPEFGIKDIENY